MSIFPKRTLQGRTVTIHWNYNTAHLKDVVICPFVRIGVTDPLGNTTILFEKHIPALPAVQEERDIKEGQFLYLSKNTPLLVLAAYLSGRHNKEKLVEILQNIQSGKHYYFTYNIPQDAAPGKYILLSEVYSGGEIRYSKTAADDFFFVEKLSIEPVESSGPGYKSRIINHSPEPVPVKVIDYEPGKQVTPPCLQVFELKGREIREVAFFHEHSYLSYNEERELLPLFRTEEPRCIRNQKLLELIKNNGEEIYLFHPDSDETYQLTPAQGEIWLSADGIHSRAELREGRQELYDDMLKQELIEEITV